jgi:hypothetical protein
MDREVVEIVVERAQDEEGRIEIRMLYQRDQAISPVSR